MTSRTRHLVSVAVISVVASAALATHPQKWTADTEDAFAKGVGDKVVLTSHGEIKLSRALKSALAEDAAVGQVFALAQGKDGTIYAAVAGDQTTGKILVIKDGKSSVFAEVELTPLFSSTMLVDEAGRLIVGGCGDTARVLRFPAPNAATTAPVKPEVLFEDKDSKYVWAVAKGPDGTLYAATGPAGKLVAIAPDGKAEVVYTVEEGNFLSLAVNREGIVYIGADPHAVVYRFDPRTKKATVVLSATETEISALAIDAAGNVYAATGAPVDGAEPATPGHGHKGTPDNGLPEPKDSPIPPMQPPGANPKHRHDLGFLMRNSAFVPPGGAGPIGPGGVGPGKGKGRGQPAMPPMPHGGDAEVPAEGNAVYRIDPEGFISEVFRAPVTIRAMLEHDGVLTLGTGSDGEIYEVDARREEQGVLATADAKDITALLLLADGSIAVGQANDGGVSLLSAGLASEGTYTTEVFDATGVARLGVVRLDGSLPPGTSLTLSTRSGNFSDPNASWSEWTAEVPAEKFVKITSPASRYFQARLTFKSNGSDTPVVRALEASYQLPNAAPVISSVTVGDGGEDKPDEKSEEKALGPVKHITWDAKDPNDDALVFTLQYRPSGEKEWRLLKDHLTEPAFEWDTKSVPDGRYQVRVVASDAPDNVPGTEKLSSRVSSSFLVDNTPPEFSEITSKIEGKTAEIRFVVKDAASTVAGVKWRDGATGEWRTAECEGKMFDSPSATVVVSLRDLSSGRHIIALKAVDDRGNERFESVPIEIK